MCHSMKQYYVYILASKRNGTLYIGVTNNLERRIYEHKQGSLPGFTRQYRIHRLVHVETSDSIQDVIRREKQLKLWSRSWKKALIEKNNPTWEDLSLT